MTMYSNFVFHRLFLVVWSLTASLGYSSSSSGAVQLTKENFEEEISGKNAFVKFFAPWCGHCKAMKPDWDELGSDYAGSSSVLIGDVDCTSPESEDLCSKYGVQGYPTLKYFQDGNIDKPIDYSSGRDLDSLKEFVAKELEIACSVNDTSKCSDKEIKFLEKMKSESAESRKKQLDRLSKMKGSSMKAELKQWLTQRLRILTSLDQEL
jgi:protein disulfide-isomerase A6